ncbi:hypothetical protein ACIA5C_40100 [Actinoplanes sp. NPDC051343]|uniref:hypothetical protein n=1 Tax=Actinoplanes sp. NPDC051343 TaxID=3363906 RepID=UPI003797C913
MRHGVAGVHRSVLSAILFWPAAAVWVCAVMAGSVLRRWVTPTMGTSFVLAAAALLSATLAVPYRSRRLCSIALVLTVAGLASTGSRPCDSA